MMCLPFEDAVEACSAGSGVAQRKIFLKYKFSSFPEAINVAPVKVAAGVRFVVNG